MRVGNTAPGPFRGTDPREVARTILGECPMLPVVPELEDRGPGADQVGRTAAMLAELGVDISPRGWRLSDAPGRISRRAKDFLDRDFDAVEEADEALRDTESDPVSGNRRLLLRVLGPWSLAARLELPGGLPVLTDRGAHRDVAAALAEGVADRVIRLASRMGAGARILLDEPVLWAVAAGTVPTPSRLDPVPAVPGDRLAVTLSRFAAALRGAGVDEVLIRVPSVSGPDSPARWSIVSDPPRDAAPFDGICLDAAVLHAATVHDALDAAGTVLGDGGILQLEGLPGAARLPATRAEVEQSVESILALLDRLSAPRYASLPGLVLTPTVGEMTSARSGTAAALAAVRRVAEVAPRLAE